MYFIVQSVDWVNKNIETKSIKNVLGFLVSFHWQRIIYNNKFYKIINFNFKIEIVYFIVKKVLTEWIQIKIATMFNRKFLGLLVPFLFIEKKFSWQVLENCNLKHVQ